MLFWLHLRRLEAKILGADTAEEDLLARYAGGNLDHTGWVDGRAASNCGQESATGMLARRRAFVSPCMSGAEDVPAPEWPSQNISQEGSVELCLAMIEPGHGLLNTTRLPL